MASCTLGDEPQAVSPGRADWQSVLAEGVRSAGELCRLLGLGPSVAAEAERAAEGWPLLVPRPYIARIRPGDPSDPLLLQVLPRMAETAASPGFRADPLDETTALCGPGLLRKYQGRLLMVASGLCAVHCRYCFRRHFLGARDEGRGARGEGRGARNEGGGGKAEGGRGKAELIGSPDSQIPNPQSLIPNPFLNGPHPSPLPEGDGTLETIVADRSIHEVILSGGDPLMVPDERLSRLAEELASVPHLRRLRIHTRMPVMIPQRVTGELTGWLRANRLTPVVVVQVNHPAEIDGDVAKAFGRLVDAGIPLLNQSVLLRGVNDRADVLAELCERLVDLRVMPYYLHQLDAVAGAAHFEVPVATSLALISELRARLPGYAVPRYVRETAGAASKEVLG
jgi:L-lysine 2,3-aminomutase